jgi:two-component sensor histidine kinase
MASGPKQKDSISVLRRYLPAPAGLAAWLLAAVLVAAAAAIKAPLDAFVGENLPPYITFYPVVVFAALIGGPVVGLAAAAGTLLAAWYLWIPPPHSFAIPTTAAAITIGLYAATSSPLAWLVGSARLAFDFVATRGSEREGAARESVHRIKNLIAIVQAVAFKVAREVDSVEDYRRVLSDRLTALGAAQDVLLRQDWQDADIGEVVEGAMAPFLRNPGLTLRKGPPALTPARYVSGLSMALYELSTNAMKYGALADGKGPVVLSWDVADGKCTLRWQETLRTPAPASGPVWCAMPCRTKTA